METEPDVPKQTPPFPGSATDRKLPLPLTLGYLRLPMGSLEIEGKPQNPNMNENIEEDDGVSPIEEVRLTVPTRDDHTLPVWTFRMWFLGIASCIILSFLNTFFSYRTEPLTISMISVQVVTLPIGRFMAKTLPTAKFRVPGFGGREFSLNPGPFNVKEHVLISIFANVGSSTAYAVGIIDIIMAFYKRKISFLASWILVLTTQVIYLFIILFLCMVVAEMCCFCNVNDMKMLGYGWAGIMRKYVVDPAEMWWPLSLMQVSLFR